MADVARGGVSDLGASPDQAPTFPMSPPPVPPPGLLPVPSPGMGPERGPRPARDRGWRRWVWLAVVIGFVAACAIGMLIFLGFNIGLTGLLVGLAAAILPVPLLVGCFLWLDRYEPEPMRYLLFCFAWGAFVSTAAALAVNTLTASLFERWGLPDALVAVLVAPFIEESTKALGPLLLLWRRRREWSGVTDGIVYCGLSAVGFAMVENILYLGGHGYAQGADQYGPATGAQNLFAIYIVRILFTGFAHPLFTSMSGVGMGIAARAADRRVVWLAPVAGLLVAMMLHGTWNLMPTLATAIGQPMIVVYGYVGVMLPIFLAMVGLAVGLRGWEGRLSERTLPLYVNAGWFTPPELAALGSLGRRHSARQWARRVAGVPGIRAMRGFQFSATQLALLRDGMRRGLDREPRDAQRAADEELRLLESIVAHREVFTGRDPQMPSAFWDGTGYQITFPDGVRRDVAAPDEPVVPVPVALAAAPRLAPAYAPAYPVPGYPQPGYAQAYPTPGYPQPGYGQGYPPHGYPQPSYPQPSYPQPGYAQPGYAQPGYAQPGYAQPGYPQPEDYRPSGYAQPRDYPPSGS